MNVVVNTAPLLFLSRINRLPILRAFGQIWTPEAVISEIRYKQDEKTQAVNQAIAEWLIIKPVVDKNLLAVLTAELDLGEAEVITVAIEQKADWVVLDDQDARRYAHRYGLKVIGTLGLLAWAKKKGHISSLKQEIEHLREAGIYAVDELILSLLREVGEV
jgi:uncharacterized protein